MDDENGDNNRAAPDGFDSWNAYWTAQGMPWRTEPEIGEERQAYLAERRTITPDIKQGIYPYRGIRLKRPDVEWLLATHECRGIAGPVDTDDNKQRGRDGLDLRGTDLQGADLHLLPLARSIGGLAKAELRVATPAQLQNAAVHLAGSNLRYTHLEESILTCAHLEGANLQLAHLEGADCYQAHLEANEPGSLRRASFDAASILDGVTLANTFGVTPRLGDVRWNNTLLSSMAWEKVKTVGEEYEASISKGRDGARKTRTRRLLEYQTAVSTYLQLVTLLRAQGRSDVADRFAYRAQVLQRTVFWHQRQFGKWLFSLLLATLSGYGFRLGRMLFAYGFLVSLFAALYLLLSSGCSASAFPQVLLSAAHCASNGHTYSWTKAFVISVTAFHGRVFAESYQPDTPFGIVAAVEAIVGLVIEGVFIAMLTQRFFAR